MVSDLPGSLIWSTCYLKVRFKDYADCLSSPGAKKNKFQGLIQFFKKGLADILSHDVISGNCILQVHM